MDFLFQHVRDIVNGGLVQISWQLFSFGEESDVMPDQKKEYHLSLIINHIP